MRIRCTLLFLLCMIFQQAFTQDERVVARNPEVIIGQLIRETAPLRDFRRPAGWVDVPVRDENGRIFPDERRPIPFEPTIFPGQQDAADPVLQVSYPSLQQNNALRSIGSNFNGMGYTFVNPPDPTICAGPNHIIQMINGNSGAYFKIFNKSGGQVVGQTFMDQLTGRGGLGDPIALYDQLADRFIMLEFANKSENGNSEGLIIAVSKTSDPAGAWSVYFYGYGNTFPDYPKLSVWNNAYYCTTNDFANAFSYSGSSVWAFDRAAMIAGNATASAQRFTMGNTSKFFSMCPVLLQGSALPPAGTGGLIAYMQDNAWTSSTTDLDSVGLYEFLPDFSSPSNTVIRYKASMATGGFISGICGATRGRCISQPGSTVALEALHQKVMNQPVYRNFGTHQGIVLTHVVDKGSNISGVRWYELKNTGSNWVINQQSTFTPDNTHRWMPSICYDQNGNIGLAYNVSSSLTGVYPGIRYTGRKACDPLNQMTYSEDLIVAGTASNSSSRYGDYNHLVADPNGLTFWVTGQWNGASTWSTRIASFTLDACTAATCGDPTGLNATPSTYSVSLAWSAVNTAVSYDVEYKLAGSSTWSSGGNTTGTSMNISNLSPSTLYDWRVRANCPEAIGNFVSGQFTTESAATICATPGGLGSTNITTNSATISWSAVTEAQNYDVDYKLASATDWFNAISGTTALSLNLGGLNAGSVYDWRVRANCSGNSSSYAQAQFTTNAPPVTCPGAYDVSTNNNISGAATIPLNTDVLGTISSRTDQDYYGFSTLGAGTVNISLTNLPANYQLALLSSGGSTLATSQQNGTSNESISMTLNAGNYFVRVYPKANASNASSCYVLKVAVGTGTQPDMITSVDPLRKQVSVFPNPSNNSITVQITGYEGSYRISLYDLNGKLVMDRMGAAANTQLNISRIPAGVYMMKVMQGGKEISSGKVLKY
jgi:hypothetical protein